MLKNSFNVPLSLRFVVIPFHENLDTICSRTAQELHPLPRCLPKCINFKVKRYYSTPKIINNGSYVARFLIEKY